jgi:parallel beta-helix repeat protein
VISIDNDGSDLTAPDDVTNLAATPGNEFVYLSWTRSVDSDQDLVDQLLDISDDGGTSWSIAVSLGKEAYFYLAGGLTNSQPYKFRLRVKDSSGNTSAGVIVDSTPSATAYTTVSGTIGTDTTWAAGVYYVSNNLTISSGVTLSINPGVVVKFAASRYLDIRGNLHAVGTAADPVVFTAFSDDDYAGDTNGDGVSSGTPGYWRDLYFYGSADSRLEHVSPLVEDSTFMRNGGGFHLYSGAAVIQSNEIRESSGHGIYVNYAVPTIDGNVIADNGSYGIYYQRATASQTITGNTITGNAKPVRLPFSAVPGPGDGNTLGGNTVDQIEIHGNSLNHPLTLTPEMVYWQVGGTATVATGVNLVVQPGVIWKFALNTRMDVNGALTAVGTPAERITFTSYRDDSVGGDTNGDGASQGQDGDWHRIFFGDAVIDFLTRLEYVDVRYGGGSNEGNIYFYYTNIALVSSEISDSSSYGIYNYASSPLIQSSVLADNSWDGIYINGTGSPQISGGQIRGNSNGIHVYSGNATVTIQDNQITGNSGWGVYFRYGQATPLLTGNTLTGNYRNMIVPASALPNSGDGNVLVPNTIDGVWIRGNARGTDLRLEVLSDGAGHEINTYQVYGTVTVNAGVKLTVDPGVVVKFHDNAGITVHGGLSAAGTAAQPVVFTSWKDDEYGGDLNLNGYANAPVNGDWNSIYVSDQATAAWCVLDHAVVRYGGRGNNSQFYVYRTGFNISNSVFSNSSTHGIRSYEAALALSGNEIFGNSWSGMSIESYTAKLVTIVGGRIFANFGHGVDIYHNQQLTVSGSELFGNLGNGIARSNNAVVTADGNWWGAADGPGGVLPGSGDEVSAGVTVATRSAPG